MKNIKLFLSILILLFISPLTFAKSDYEELDSIIAIVENDVITKKELKKAVSEIKTNQRNKNKVVNQTKLRKLALDQLIERKIIAQYAEAQNINIESAVIENALKNIASNNKMSVEDLKKNAYKEGSLEELYSEIRFQLILRAIKERAIFSQIHISDYEIEKFIDKEKVNNPDQYKISHILIKLGSESQREAAEEKIKEVQILLKDKPFQEIAKKFSNGPFAKNGGDMGWLNFNDLPDLFVDKIIKLKKNEVSFPFESKNGLHIIKLENIKSSKKNKVFSSQYNINQILIKNNQFTSEDDILKKLDKIRNEIIEGLPFKDAAAQYSEDSTSSLKGGSLGWVDRNNLLPEFQVELDKGELNNLIGPFKTSSGWHLIELIGKREKDVTEDSRKLAARIKILNYKAEIRYKDWFEILKQSSNIEMISN